MTDTSTAATGVELLERALGYTRTVLASVTDELLDRRTPCRSWDLGELLAHMEDALDAFTEGAHGRVDCAAQPDPRRPVALRVTALRDKACALLGAWAGTVPASVEVGGLRLDTALLARAAALEVAVHGWDVAQATGLGTRLPEALARDLMSVAQQLVGEADRGLRFGPARPGTDDAPADVRLLRFLGRAPSWPARQNPGESGPRPRAAS